MNSSLPCRTDLRLYDNSWYKPGSFLKRTAWYFINIAFIKCHWNPSSGLRTALLRLFGARIGRGIILRPGLNIKFPWHLTIGDNSWIGENVWIDNLAPVSIGNNCCISQGAMLLCGNHNFRLPAFDLMVKPVDIHDGAWIGAKSVVCPGVSVGREAILTVGSIATTDLSENTIYQGNPAKAKKPRHI